MQDLAKEGLTMIVVTHEMEFRRCSLAVIFMDKGVIAEQGDPKNLSNPKEERKEFLQRLH